MTMDQLKKRGRHLTSRCPHCGKEDKNIDHLLLLCTKAQELWAVLFAIFGVNWVLPCSIWETLIGWKGPFARKTLKMTWMAAPICIFGQFGGRGIGCL